RDRLRVPRRAAGPGAPLLTRGGRTPGGAPAAPPGGPPPRGEPPPPPPGFPPPPRPRAADGAPASPRARGGPPPAPPPRRPRHPARHHVQLPRLQRHVTGVHPDGQPAVHHQEQLVGVGVHVPDELAPHLGQLDLVVVHRGDPLGLPVPVEQRQRGDQVDLGRPI